MNIKQIIYSIIIAAALIITGCEKTVTEYVEKEFSWKEHEDFQVYHRMIHGIKVINNESMYVSTKFRLSKIKKGSTEAINVMDYDGYPYNVLGFKPLITEHFVTLMERYAEQIAFFVHSHPKTGETYQYSHSTYWLDWIVDTLATDYAKFGPHSYVYPVGAINENNQFLTYYADDQSYLALYDLSYGEESNPVIITNFKEIVFSEFDYQAPWDIFTKDGYFFLSGPCGVGDVCANVLSPDGDLRAIRINDIRFYVNQFFEWQGSLYAADQTPAIWKSDDLGMTWEKTLEFNWGYRFYVIDGKLIAHRKGHLFYVDAENEEMREIMMDGIEGTEVNDICEFDGNVYLSTFSGLFYKPFDEFFTYKEEAAANSDLLKITKIDSSFD